MSDELWTWHELVLATKGQAEGVPAGPVTGVSIDTRSLQTGDLFVALTDVRDGHDFVSKAFKSGAAAALVSRRYVRQPGDGALLRVDEPLRALEALGHAARARLAPDTWVIAVTGSAGKTTTKEMLRAGLAHLGRVHASEKSYNNHWGVPLTLARMPADTDFAVFELGMNHAGEITRLTMQVRPHVAVITTIAPAHLGNFESIEGIAEAKAEIFSGLTYGGCAIIPKDSPYFQLLAGRAEQMTGGPDAKRLAHGGKRILNFGEARDADFCVRDIVLAAEKSKAMLVWPAHDPVPFEVGVPGRHNVMNAAAVLAAFTVVRADFPAPSEPGTPDPALAGLLDTLSSIRLDPAGRGQVHECGGMTVIDESYNANPASMAAAFATMALRPKGNRLIAVLGDMLELGSHADDLHLGLKPAIETAGIDLVFACGPHMKVLFDHLPPNMQAAWAATSADLRGPLLAALRSGDVVMIKGSLGSRMALLVDAIKSQAP